MVSGTVSTAGQWKVLEHQDAFWLANVKDPAIKSQITSVGGTPEFVEVIRPEKISPVILLKYFAGTSGTSVTIDEYWAVIYNPETERFFGDYPYAYKNYPDGIQVSEPVWSFSKDAVHIVDKEASIDKVINVE